ncbi:hypothetical protein [Helicobacter cappadocius]|uniref:Uncharacterized protein n=1 Tax=Helicobacter cappadocius TaxID=3063998 RepID=A0AA90PIE0_9HELI|nr:MULTISPECIES: hypothetical protein [unclassified Helicobacter]MDO7253057.1 hypothetical protein [Helicobacter sp. faydin-H75]MDP2538817.1 hypothetical protein [Helicobacter sp. faydin-H76]
MKEQSMNMTKQITNTIHQLIKTIFLSTVSIVMLNAITPVQEVHDSQANATAAITASRMADQITKASKMIEQYNQIITEAKATVAQLDQINQMMNGVNSFLNGSSIAIANPAEFIDDANDIIKRMGENAQRLQKTLKNYDIRDHLHWKRISTNCPWLSYDKIAPKQIKMLLSKIGIESEEIKAFKRLGDALSDDITSNTQAVAGTLSGRALALEFCAKASVIRHNIDMHDCKLKLDEYSLSGDLYSYAKTKEECNKKERDYRKDMMVFKSEQTNPLLNRSKQMMEALGVLDKSYNKKGTGKDNKGAKIYCKEGSNDDEGEFCYPLFYDTKRLNDNFADIQKELVDKLTKAGSDKTAQANAYADVKQKSDTLMLSYIKDIANNLSFMNETMSLVGNLIARDYKHKYGDEDYDESDEELDKKITEMNEEFFNNTQEYKSITDYKANLDKYGFPIVSLKSKKEDKD